MKILCLSILSSVAQNTSERSIDPFTRLEVLGAAKVFYHTSDTLSLKIIGDASDADKVQTINKDGLLTIEVKDKNDGALVIHVSNKELSSLYCNGAVHFKTTNAIAADEFTVTASGAAFIKAQIEAKKITASVSGAGNMSLNGSADELIVSATGASVFKGYELKSKVVNVETGGASTAKVNAIEKITANASGASSIANPS